MNIYSDAFQSALKYLKDTEVNINNLILMTGDFNIRDSLWDPLFPHHSSISDDLFILVDSFKLDLSTPTDSIPTRYSDTPGELDLVIDLMFLHNGSSELNCYSIHLSWRLISDHAPLTITISIKKEHVMTSKFSLSKDSEEEEEFIKEVIRIFKLLNNTIPQDWESLEQVINLLAASIEQAWNTNARRVRITKHSKIWWNEDCRRSLNIYRELRCLDDWKLFKKIIKTTKRVFFNTKIQKVTNKSCRFWKLMNWVNKYKLPAIEAIKYNNQLCLSLNSLWNALHSSFNTALHYQVNVSILDEIKNKQTSIWTLFLKEEFKITLGSCNNSLTPGPDKLSWRHLKSIMKNDDCITNVIKITNACINLEYWPNHFKISSMVIIPKPNKPSYDSPKSFRPIVLLNTLGN